MACDGPPYAPLRSAGNVELLSFATVNIRERATSGNDEFISEGRRAV